MDEQLKKKWVEALRSGKYKQGQCYLKRRGDDAEDYYCCLGVLCDIINPNGWLKNNYHILQDVNVCQFIIKDVWKDIEPNIEQGTLSTMNDNGNSFEWIADFIERNM